MAETRTNDGAGWGAIALDGMWQLTWSEDCPDVPAAPDAPGQMWLPARVPAPVHEALMEAGIIEDPNIGLNSLRCRWVEEQFWVYRREFTVPADVMDCAQWLVFDWLELDASVRLNGHEVGRHRNAHRRARFPVNGHLKPGPNVIVVVVESGLQAVNEVPVAGYGFDPLARQTRRPLLRKAQYQCGWDWNPRMMNVGVLGSARLEWARTALLDSSWVVTTVSEDLRSACVAACAKVLWDPGADQSATLRASIRETGAQCRIAITPSPDPTGHRVELPIEDPKLWWPRGHGEQSLYTVDISLETGDQAQARTLRTGVRKVEIDQSPHPEAGSHFILRINDRPVFCKGGNWVPPDLMPSRPGPDHYRRLVDLAAEANCNMLRVWGGGVFAPQALADACDEAGVLLWHDFLFACAKYPGDDPEFVTEVELEVTEAVRDLTRHPSLAVWCGNNEIGWGDREWGYRQRRPVGPHHALFHLHIPQIVAAEDPSKVYWPSSPWSPGFAAPNDPTVGDQHPWGVSILDPGPADFWKYRGYVDRFPNEGGVLGASLPVALDDFLPDGDKRMLSPSWVHHDNPIGFRGSAPGDIGRVYDTFRLWTGLDPFALPMDEYALLSGVLQADGLSEYITNYRRRMFSSASAIFWMYNDSWPATHGWTIVDYGLRRKLSYHPVRRAFAPVTVVVADEGDEIGLFGVNDTPVPWSGRLRYGVFGLSGGYPLDHEMDAVIPANSAIRLAHFERSKLDEAGPSRCGAFGLLYAGSGVVAQHRLFVRRFHELQFADPRITVTRQGDHAVFACDSFAWGVCVDLSGAAVGDNCFDLLPGVGYTVAWPSAAGGPEIRYVGSRALLHARRRA